jgi:hypothetical protein
MDEKSLPGDTTFKIWCKKQLFTKDAVDCTVTQKMTFVFRSWIYILMQLVPPRFARYATLCPTLFFVSLPLIQVQAKIFEALP